MDKFVFLGEGTQFFSDIDFGNLKGDQKIGKIGKKSKKGPKRSLLVIQNHLSSYWYASIWGKPNFFLCRFWKSQGGSEKIGKKIKILASDSEPPIKLLVLI